MMRQQRVLAAVREQAIGWDLPVKLPGIASTILDATATNMTANEIIKLAYWLVTLDGDHMSQIVISAPSQAIEGKQVMVADQEVLKNAVTRLLTSPAEGQAPGAATSTSSGSTATTSRAPGSTSTVTVSGDPSDYPDRDRWKEAQKDVPFALEAPRFIPAGFAYAYRMPAGQGTYQLQPGENSKPAVRIAYRDGTKDLYLGITATTWADAPVAAKGREVQSNGVTYTIVGTSGKVHHIWWKKNGVLYFISNTLMYTLSNEDLLKMATSMAPLEGAE
jgi:hypothetical protein